jgi:hypothetical protein
MIVEEVTLNARQRSALVNPRRRTASRARIKVDYVCFEHSPKPRECY